MNHAQRGFRVSRNKRLNLNFEDWLLDGKQISESKPSHPEP